MSASSSPVRVFFAVLLAAGCTPPPPPPPPVPDPPQVFLTALESNVVGTSFKLNVNVTGCDKVVDVSIYDHDTFIKRVPFTASPTPFELSSGELGGQYSNWGLALELLVHAKASCDDARSNKSMPVSGKFFPVEKIYEGPGGTQAVPDVFYAEGGLAGSLPSFVGCVGTSTGTALLRVGFNKDTGDLESQAANTSLPFPCSISSQFSERNAATGKHWMWERNVGALAYDQNMNITSYVLGKVQALTVAPDGDGIIWIGSTMGLGVQRVAHVGGPGANVMWNFLPNGLVMGNPYFVGGANRVRLPVFADDMGSSTGTVWIQDVDYTNGALAAEYDLKLINYGFLNTPEIPPAAFSSDGAILYFPYTSGSGGVITSRVVACATNARACSGSSLKWESPLLEGQTLATLLFSSGNQIAVIGAQTMYSINAMTGLVTSFDARPVRPGGSLSILGAQVGTGTDFYLINGLAGYYPIEVVAIDSPTQGELYRYEMGGGTSPSAAMTLAVDDAGQLWMRLGMKLVKPLKNAEYRAAKGANKIGEP